MDPELQLIPEGHHLVRLCKGRHVQDGVILPTAFSARPDETYLSTQWLEYLGGERSIAAGFKLLREFYLISPWGDLKLTGNMRFAAVKVDSLRTEEGVECESGKLPCKFVCQHAPRDKTTFLPLQENPDIRASGFDPHAAIYTLPPHSAEQLAVQQFLLSKVCASEVAMPKPSPTI